ncbi:MAG: hypothetical protein NT118_13065 [Lentisphaerae bacterium]|nr:hypothetical protein [Lentisphaerota bacterium]
MRNIITLVVGTAVLLVLSGCGSLNQKVGGPELSKPAMEYANQLSADNSSMSISYGGKELSTSKWGSKLYPIFPAFYWSTIGNFTPEPSYGVRTATILFPVFVLFRDSVYDSLGQRLQYETTFNVDFVIGYEDRVTPSSSDFRTGVLWIPGIGPFLSEPAPNSSSSSGFRSATSSRE